MSPASSHLAGQLPLALPQAAKLDHFLTAINNWVERVNQPQTQAELEALRRSVHRGQPFGSEIWQARVAKELELEHTFRPLGRPKKKAEDAD